MNSLLSGSQIIGASASASVPPMNIQDWCPLGWTGLISLQSLLQHNSSKAPILWQSTFFLDQISHIYMTTGKTMALTIQTFVVKVMFLLFNTLSGFVIAFLPRSKCLNFEAAVTVHSDFGAQEIKVCHCFHFPPLLFAMKWWYWMLTYYWFHVPKWNKRSLIWLQCLKAWEILLQENSLWVTLKAYDMEEGSFFH